MARMLLKPPSCGVFFGNLHSKVTDKHLLELGTQAGPVHRASKSKDSAFGFVEYADVESAIYCVGLYHGLLRLFGQSVTVNFSNSPAGQLTPQEQALLDRCIAAIDLTAASSNAAYSDYAGAGAVRRGGRDTQRYTPYGDARGHREQRAATRAPCRFNDDEDAVEYGAAFGGSDGYGWPGHAAAVAAAAAQPPPAALPPRPLGAGAVAAMQAAAAGLAQPSLPPLQQQAGGWQVAPPAPVPAQHVNPQQVHVVIQQQQQQPPQQPPQQPAQVYQLVQQTAPAAYAQPQQAPPVYTQPQQQYQQYQAVDPAAAAYQQWHQQQHQQHQQHHHHQQQQQQQYPPQHVQYGTPGGGFQTSMPPVLPGQQQHQQQQHAWYQ